MGSKTALQGDPLAKRPDETTTQWKMRIALASAMAGKEREGVNPFAKSHGHYVDRFITHGEENTRAKVAVNRGGTPLCRWEASGKLNTTQLAAIELCQHLWRLSGLNQRVTANYGERIPGDGNSEARAASEIEARDDLQRIRGYFPGPLRGYFGVFEDVCRHQMPAGSAGATVGYDDKAATARALTIVCFVADTIAMHERL